MLLRAFRSLMPRDERFVERFCAHSKLIVLGSRSLPRPDVGRWPGRGPCAEINRLEEAADAITRETVLAIHRTFVTPFDRSQILDLITALDDTIDLMKDTGRRMLRYGVGFTPEMQGMADCAVRAATEIRDAMPLLGSHRPQCRPASAMSIAVRGIEGEADELLDRGLKALFSGDTSPGHKLTVEKVYDLIEAVVDRCEDIVDVIDGIVVEQV